MAAPSVCSISQGSVRGCGVGKVGWGRVGENSRDPGGSAFPRDPRNEGCHPTMLPSPGVPQTEMILLGSSSFLPPRLSCWNSGSSLVCRTLLEKREAPCRLQQNLDLRELWAPWRWVLGNWCCHWTVVSLALLICGPPEASRSRQAATLLSVPGGGGVRGPGDKEEGHGWGAWLLVARAGVMWVTPGV